VIYACLVAGDLSPTARALRVLEILQTRRVTTAVELADQLGVTERAARRYIAILREAGVPVDSERGPYGGYQLGRRIRLPPLTFTATEALGLVMAVLETNHRAAGDDTVGAALDKFLRALPENVGRQALVMREHAATAVDRRAARPDPSVSAAVVAAVAAKRRVRMTYRNESGRVWEGDADPWAVVVRHGLWYLAGFSHRASAIRTFRLDRVVAVTQLDDHVEPPEGIDPVALVEEHLGSGWKYRTRVLFDATLDDVQPWISGPMGKLEPSDDGTRCVLIGTTRNPEMYAGEWLATVPFPFRVTDGPELIEAVATLAQRFTAAIDTAGKRP
jgi:predicted DNA-binding transcriptional regulator YafY